MLLSKKTVLVLVIVLVFILAGGGLFYLQNKSTESGKEKEIINPDFQQEKSVTVTPEVLKNYQDETGLSFKYSPSLSIIEAKNQSNDTYQSLEFTSAIKPGELMTLKITDTGFKDLNEWLTKSQQTDWQTNETVLGQMNAKLINSPNKIILVAIKQGILFLFEAPNDADSFWTKQIAVVAQNFVLKTTSSSGSSQSTQNDIEEIIE
jgi:hypothetical protein